MVVNVVFVLLCYAFSTCLHGTVFAVKIHGIRVDNATSTHVHSATVCQRDQLAISCPDGGKIAITTVLYGRRTGNTCNAPPILSINCPGGPQQKQIVQHMCDNRNQCVVQASNKVFGDTCFGTVKYLNVTYTCKNDTDLVVEACENDELEFECPENSAIYVTWANYGRLTRGICESPHIHVTQCENPSTLITVKQACEGNRVCKLIANNELFGDPCFGTTKYLTVKYRCITPEATFAAACEHEQLALRCAAGTVLDVVDASYGRTGRQHCNTEPITHVNCKANVRQQVVHACQHRPSCDIEVSSHVFGDPCYGTVKYLQVLYNCFMPAVRVGVACENEELELECKEPGTVLTIVEASYGREGRSLCRREPISTLSCAATNARRVVRRMCNGKVSCIVGANQGVFFNPCPHTTKYLHVTYACASPSLVQTRR